MKYGRFLRKCRVEKKATLKTIAGKIGVSISYLSDVERGRRDPFDDSKNKILAQEFGVEFLKLKNLTVKEHEGVWLSTFGMSDIANDIVALLAVSFSELDDEELMGLFDYLLGVASFVYRANYNPDEIGS